ncbi:MAG TPA: DUF4386 family protein [Thermoanaerobaculia bacterium]
MRRLNPGRFAACLYLLASAPGFFSYMVVMPRLIATGDAAATARNILGSETLFRLSILSELISSIVFIFLVLAFYRLFRDVDRSHAIAMVVLVLVSIPVSLFNVLNNLAALWLLKGGGSLVAMSQSQLQGLAMIFLRLHGAGLNIAAIFWGLWLLPLGVLIRRSGFVPRILGTLLLFNGIAYPAVTVIWLMLPDYTSIAARVALIPELGEAWLMLWLLIKGIPARVGDQPARAPERTATPKLASVLVLAIATLCTSAKAQTNSAAAVYENGRAALDHGDPERAAKYFEHAIALRPDVADYHHRLGDAYEVSALTAGVLERMSFIRKAKAEWDRAVELDPNCIGARQSLAEFYAMAPAMMGGSESMAREQAAQIAKRDAIEGHRAYARIYTATNRPDLARNEYAEMLKTDGRSVRAHYWHGVYLMATEKNYSAAAAEFESAVKLDPAYMPAYFQIGHVAALTGESLAPGEQALKKYLTYQPKEDEPSTARAHYWLGTIYEKQHRNAEARERYAASLRINPNQKDVQTAQQRVAD